MKHASRGVAASVLMLATLSQVSFAQARLDLGKSEYESSCASCHGVSGKGDGAMVGMLTKPPSDLTTLARRNGGVFPVQRVSEMIDGRTSVMIGSHGAREMPVWGHVYRSEDTQPRDLHARNRISSLVDYLARIQGK
jgi:mono/diheme cytochrome c family protein